MISVHVQREIWTQTHIGEMMRTHRETAVGQQRQRLEERGCRTRGTEDRLHHRRLEQAGRALPRVSESAALPAP